MALEFAAGHPEFPAGLVLLDLGVLFPTSAATVFAGYLEGLRGPDFADQVRKIVATPVCRPTHAAHVEQTFLATPQHVLVSAFESLFPWDVDRARECAEAARSRCCTSKRPIGSRIWIAVRHCARDWSRPRPSVRAFPVARSTGADQPDDRPIYLALRSKTPVNFVAAGSIRRRR